jgi:hypothetical protein
LFPQEGQGVPEEVFLGDGPHSHYKGHMHNASVATRTSAALLQMTQLPAADWAPVEFSPSVFNASTPATPASGAQQAHEEAPVGEERAERRPRERRHARKLVAARRRDAARLARGRRR